MYAKLIGDTERHAYPDSYAEYICDTLDDIKLLPTNKRKRLNDEYCCIGSKVFISDLDKIYILNNHSEWVFLKDVKKDNSGGGGSGSTTSLNIEIATVSEVKSYLNI